MPPQTRSVRVHHSIATQAAQFPIECHVTLDTAGGMPLEIACLG